MIRLGLSLAASILFSSLLLGCAPQTDLALSFRAIEWSEKVRPDLEPLTPGQRTAPQTLFSDGGLQGDQPVSALFPDPGSDLAGLRRLGYAPTLWVPAGTRFVLSYETVLTEPHLNRGPIGMTDGAYSNRLSVPLLKAHAGAVSGRGGTEPATRRFLVYPGTNPPSVFSPNAPNFFVLPTDLLHVALEACTNGPIRRNLDNPPGALTEECTRRWVIRDRCAGNVGRFTWFPFTVLKCVLVNAPVFDTTYRLVAVSANDSNQLADVDYPGSTQTPKILGHIKVIDRDRMLRRVTIGSEECGMPDGVGGVAKCDETKLNVLEEFRVCSGRIPHPRGVRLDCAALTPLAVQGFDSITGLWTFSVADPVTGGFREQFLAGVRVSHVKAFALRPQRNAPRRYLTAQEITELRVAIGVGAGRINAACRVETEIGTGHASVNPQNCSEDISPLTVAWAAGRTDTPSLWTLVQRVPSEPSVFVGRFCPGSAPCTDVNATGVLTRDLTILPDETVFLEFHLRS